MSQRPGSRETSVGFLFISLKGRDCKGRCCIRSPGSSSSEDKDQSLRTHSMATSDLAVGMVFLLHTVIGVLGNFSLLYHFLFLYFTGYRLRLINLIINNLIVANFSVLFSSGLSYTLASFGWYHHFSDFGCKFFLYVRGVGRGVSIGTTCLLSIIQAITISPMNSRHKQRVQHIHRTHLFSPSAPEARATKTILLLVSTFVFLNTLSSIFHILLAILNNPNWFIWNTSSVLTLSFPTVSPFLILIRDSSVSRLSFAWLRNIKSPNIMRNMSVVCICIMFIW
ncbi:vomeronasal type-1 receptor 4-like [Phyllostomus discolor]|uniref:Vomeronasal type-1 receptor n=1 Tax=Phyllostomus discolor TaxID=89673 RepID=A0A7E6CSS4_9CHIR|nr:vomeronasal type-1 receptor 4-like [Phyllostomus discolor]